MTDSQDWWPADFGHYGPLFIRMAWHSAGTYRIRDGRGGAGSGTAALRAAQQLAGQRQPRQGAPAALADQAEVRPEDLLGRPDDPRRQRRARVDGLQDLRLRAAAARTSGSRRRTSTGVRRTTWLGDKRYSGDRELANPLGAVQMGLIYVNPEGPERQPGSARRGAGHPRDVRPHGDERRRDRRADRRRPHLRQDARRRRAVQVRRARARGRADRGAGPRLEEHASAPATAATRSRSGLEGAWTQTPTKWSNLFFDNLFNFEWELTKSPAGAQQWKPKGGAGNGSVPDAHDPSKKHAPTMLTTDLALKFDPIYGPIAIRNETSNRT